MGAIRGLFACSVVIITVAFSFALRVCNAAETSVTDCYKPLCFSSELAGLKAVSIDSEDYQGCLLKDDLILTELTEQEAKFLGRYYVAERHVLSCGTTIMAAIQLARASGELPMTGVEMLNMYHSDLLTEQGVAGFSELNSSEQLRQVYRGISPATGQFYPSLHNPEWHQFGLCITKLEGEDGLRTYPHHAYSPVTGESSEEVRLYQGWRVVVFGEDEDSVLIDKVIWTEVSTIQGNTSGGCGCKPAKA